MAEPLDPVSDKTEIYLEREKERKIYNNTTSKKGERKEK